MPVFSEVLEDYFQSLVEKRYLSMLANDKFAPLIIERLKWHKLIALAVTLSHKYAVDPKSGLDKLLQGFAVSQSINEEFYYQKAFELYKQFSAAGVPFYPLKGPFWASLIYPDPGWRHIGDLDLIIPPDSAEKVFDIISALGMIPLTEPDTNRQNMADKLNQRGQLAFSSKQTRQFMLEIHQVLVSSPRYRKSYDISMADFWNSDRKHAWREISFSVPPLETWFVYLILHGACQHQFQRFLPIVDIIHFLEAYQKDIDWEKVVHISEGWKVEKALYHSMKIVNGFSIKTFEMTSNIKKTNWFVRTQTSFLNKKAILLGTRSRGRYRRKLFRTGIT